MRTLSLKLAVFIACLVYTFGIAEAGYHRRGDDHDDKDDDDDKDDYDKKHHHGKDDDQWRHHRRHFPIWGAVLLGLFILSCIVAFIVTMVYICFCKKKRAEGKVQASDFLSPTVFVTGGPTEEKVPVDGMSSPPPTYTEKQLPNFEGEELPPSYENPKQPPVFEAESHPSPEHVTRPAANPQPEDQV